MKVRELIEQLRALDPEMEVVVAKDSEGNGFSALGTAEVSPMTDGEVIADEDVGTEYDIADVTYAVVIWP